MRFRLCGFRNQFEGINRTYTKFDETCLIISFAILQNIFVKFHYFRVTGWPYRSLRNVHVCNFKWNCIIFRFLLNYLKSIFYAHIGGLACIE